MNIKLKKSIAISMIVGLGIQLSACGTILNPERKGQSAGQLDTSIVALDAIGLLFFLVPGIIAFAVDFNNGTIYLPGGSASINTGEVNIVHIEGDVTNEKIENAIFEQTGDTISLSNSHVQSIEKMTTLVALKNEVRFL
ncbi:hypothetical protein [Psychromonas antarctica]|jgi:hypothetical protein|uniref:hypothetical protein n=1 Tax=Psychromonas antarctica TaxID=67573 RepID=UPI001EE7E5D3|nr:hypothetical protein [Psychromonas antarctica]MCG6201650.1 hypothetical protein [Psychromonas antarctica]